MYNVLIPQSVLARVDAVTECDQLVFSCNYCPLFPNVGEIDLPIAQYIRDSN